MATTPQTGTDYDALRQNNPYRNYQYTQSFWDRIGAGINNWFNGLYHDGKQRHLVKTKEMQVADEMANQARAYDAQIGEVQREEMYNSADEQAQRMRAAGINPDLQGSGITGGEASLMDNQATMNLPDMSDDTAQRLQNAGNLFMSVVSIPQTVLSLAQQGINVANEFTKFNEGKLGFMSKVNEFAKEYLLTLMDIDEDPEQYLLYSDRQWEAKIMNDDEIKSLFPMAYQRRLVAKAIRRQARNVFTNKDIFSGYGQFYGARYDPLNYDQTMAQLMMLWTREYNLNVMDYKNRYQALVNENGLPETNAELESLNAEYSLMNRQGINALIDVLSSFYNQTGDQKYAWSIIICEQLLHGQLLEAAGTAAISGAAGLAEQFKNGTLSETVEEVKEGVNQAAQTIFGNDTEVKPQDQSYFDEKGNYHAPRHLRGWQTFDRNAGQMFRLDRRAHGRGMHQARQRYMEHKRNKQNKFGRSR